jgi:hypothetical protein
MGAHAKPSLTVAILTGNKAQEAVLEQGLAIPSRAPLTHNPHFAGTGPANIA